MQPATRSFLLIPGRSSEEKKDHIEGFDAGVLGHARRTERAGPVCCCTTSETTMYPMFALWVRSHRPSAQDLPSWSSTLRPNGPGVPGARDPLIAPAIPTRRTPSARWRAFVILENIMGTCACLYPAAHGMDKLTYYTWAWTPCCRTGGQLSDHHYRRRPAGRQHHREDEKGERQVRAPDLRHVRGAGGRGRRRAQGRQGAGAPAGHLPVQVVIIPMLAKGNVEKVARYQEATAGWPPPVCASSWTTANERFPGSKFPQLGDARRPAAASRR